ncbi:MAG TPA: T9SS type A sorting domain-containing protein, partial [Chitinophagales bacterium]|nr:T9SS type A sorting domain-containing protein [Chitinophagales bacterium]
NTLTTGGTYTQTLVNAAGCDSVITLTLTVLAPVTSSVSQSICAGTSYDFNGEVLTQAGTYYDTLSNVQGCDSIVALTLAVLAPVTSSYTDNICAGGTYDFNGETLTQAGVYYDTLVSAQSCDSIVTLNLLLADTPQITQQPTVNNATVCAGATVTLSVSASGNGLSYQWKESGNSEGPDADTYTTAALTAGNKSYSVEVSNSCGTTQANTVAVTVNALPVPVITQAGAVLSTQTFSQYQWQLGGTDINGATAQSYTAVANGDYTVAVVDANGCEATSAVLNVTGVGIAEEEQLAISVYPNPAADVLIVQTALPLSKIEVYSVAGTNVLTAEGNIRLLDVSTLAQGNYTIKLTALHGNTVLKRFAKM